MSVYNYQLLLNGAFSSAFNLETICEWRSRMRQNIYSPRLDLALGPFAIEDGSQVSQEHCDLFDMHTNFFSTLAKIHLQNLGIVTDEDDEDSQQLISQKMHHLRSTNYNARCFISIEIENSVSRKHLMGGAINASALGRIAIAVGFNESKHRAFLNLYRYFEFLQEVGKPTFNTSNLLVISKDQLLETVTNY